MDHEAYVASTLGGRRDDTQQTRTRQRHGHAIITITTIIMFIIIIIINISIHTIININDIIIKLNNGLGAFVLGQVCGRRISCSLGCQFAGVCCCVNILFEIE